MGITLERIGERASRSSIPSERALGRLIFPALIFLLLIAFSPVMFHGFWAPKAAVLIALAALGARSLVRPGDRAAQFAIAALVCAFGASAVSDQPVLSLFGGVNWGTGSLFVLACLAAWSYARQAVTTHRAVATSVYAAAGLNLAVAVLQAHDLVPVAQLTATGRPFGLLGNPVHFGSLCAVAGTLAAWSASRPCARLHHLGLLALFALGVQLSGTRVALVALLAGLVVVVLGGARRRLLLPAALVLGVLLAPLAAPSDGATERLLTNGPAAASDQPNGYVVRVGVWKDGLQAALERPLLGWGPARFGAATMPTRDAAQARAVTAEYGSDTAYVDAHNIVVHQLTTTGALGLFALAGWGIAAMRGASGPFRAVAVVLFLVSLVQPLSVAITPLLFIAVGLAAPSAEQARRAPSASGRSAAAAGALLLIVPLLVGELHLWRAESSFSLREYRTAESLLPPWPEISLVGSKIASFHGLHDEPARLQALQLAHKSAQRDPLHARAWLRVGNLEALWGDTRVAQLAFERALVANPWSISALEALIKLATSSGDEVSVVRWCERLREVDHDHECTGSASPRANLFRDAREHPVHEAP